MKFTNIGERIFYYICYLVMTSLLLFVIHGVISMILFEGGLADTEYVKTKETEIKALQDNSTISGSFFLGSGSVNGTLKYYYLLNKNGGLQMESVYAEDAYIKETNSTPKEIIYELHFKNEFLRKYFIETNTRPKTEIYIPKGSIKYDYNVDLK